MMTSRVLLIVVWTGCVAEEPLDDSPQATVIDNGHSIGTNGRELAATRLEYVRTAGTIDGRPLNASLVRGELRGTCADGSCSLAGASFVNVVLEAWGLDGNPKQVRIAGAVAQTTDRYHYAIQVRDLAGAWEDACPGGYAIVVGGRWDHREGVPGGGDYDAGARDGAGRPVVTFACERSAIQKCVERLGYAPWLARWRFDQVITHCTEPEPPGKPQCTTTRPTIDADRQLEVCTRMIRGDYCGNGLSMTIDGTTIDVYDHLLGTNTGVAQPWAKEAAWFETGAACVGDLRLQTIINVPQDTPADDTVRHHLERLCPAALGQIDSVDCVPEVLVVENMPVPLVSQTPWRAVSPPVPTADHSFGSVMTSDGARLVVGLPAASAVYLFGLASGSLTIANPNLGPDRVGDRFGASVALLGNRLVVGAPGADGGFGRIYVFASPNPFDGTQGTLLRAIMNPNPNRVVVPPYDNDRFGESLAVIDGRVVVGAPLADCPGGGPDGGTVYALDLAATPPVVATAHAPRCPLGFANFGATLSTGVGGVFYAGAPIEGDAGAGGGSVYALSSATLAPVLRIPNPEPALYDGFGSAIAIAGAGKLYIGAPFDSVTGAGGAVRERAGRVFVYSILGAQLAQVVDPAPLADDHFGISLSSSPDGTKLAIGSQAFYQLGAVSVLNATTDQITSTIKNPAGTHSFFGSKVIMLGGELLIAAPLESGVSSTGALVPRAGLVYRYLGG